ncbi:MAG: hypothetical protein P4L98_05540 [Ancalomicrobiaceae bacterium]|nr:hypothetical protein [Ancalomicrobiaceae bacterium]
MTPFLKLHELAKQRGDGLTPEFLALLVRANSGPDAATIATSAAVQVLPVNASAAASSDEAIGGMSASVATGVVGRRPA